MFEGSSNVINMEIAKADYFSGNFDSAKNLLKSVKLKYEDTVVFINYYILLSYCYLSLGDKDSLLETHERIKRFEKGLENKKRFRRERTKFYYNGIRESSINIAILQNDDTLINLLSEELKEVETELQKVRLNYYMGKKYYELKNFH